MKQYIEIMLSSCYQFIRNLYNFQIKKKKLLIFKLSVSCPKNSGFTSSLINGNRIREENIRWTKIFKSLAYLNSFKGLRYRQAEAKHPRVCRDLKSFSYRHFRDLSFKRALMDLVEGIASHTSDDKSSKYESMTGREEITFSRRRRKISSILDQFLTVNYSIHGSKKMKILVEIFLFSR